MVGIGCCVNISVVLVRVLSHHLSMVSRHLNASYHSSCSRVYVFRRVSVFPYRCELLHLVLASVIDLKNCIRAMH